MEYDHPGLDDALSLALERLFVLDRELIDQEGTRAETIAHRLAHYLENECRASLLLNDLVTELLWNQRSQVHDGGDQVSLPLPTVAIHTRGENPRKILAIECRRKLLGPSDKRRLLALDGHVDGFDRALGIAWKPGAAYFLLYHVVDGGISLRRIKKSRPRINQSRPLKS